MTNDLMPLCPKCKKNYVRFAWCGKYHCSKCEWVFGKTPVTKTSVVKDQYAWWNKADGLTARQSQSGLET